MEKHGTCISVLFIYFLICGSNDGLKELKIEKEVCTRKFFPDLELIDYRCNLDRKCLLIGLRKKPRSKKEFCIDAIEEPFFFFLNELVSD